MYTDTSTDLLQLLCAISGPRPFCLGYIECGRDVALIFGLPKRYHPPREGYLDQVVQEDHPGD